MKMTEREWVQTLVDPLNKALTEIRDSKRSPRTEAGRRLPYACEIQDYAPDGISQPGTASYETDLLVSDVSAAGRWTPRVVIECKIESVTTHDALTYSTKASTHKHVHPYLRYGILLGAQRSPVLPGRLVKHGAHFDFMVTWAGTATKGSQWDQFVGLIKAEVLASRALQELLTTNRLAQRKRYRLLHRPLVLQ